MAQAKMDFIINTELNKAGFNELRKEIQGLKSITGQDLINLGQANSLKEAEEKIKAIRNSVSQMETALNKAFNPKLGTVNLQRFEKEILSMGLNVKTIATDFSKLGAQGQTAFRNIAASALTASTNIRESHEWLSKMGETMMNTVKWGISSSVWNTMTGSLEKAYSYAKNLDKSLNNIRIVSEQSADQMDRFAVQANKAAKQLGKTTLDYTNAALIYYQQGLSEEEVAKRTEATIKMANVTGEAAQDVSDYMTAVWNNFYDGSKSLEYYADVMTALGAATASSTDEIAAGLEKFAAIADTVGLSYEYATSALATVTAETRQSADTVGTAFKTLFARIQDLELGETLDDGTTLGKYSDALNKVGINIMDSNNELKDMDDILNEMGSKWETLTKAQQVSLAQTVAGTRQYAQLVALMDNWDIFQTNLTTASNATGELNKQQENYLESTQAHLNELQASTERIYKSLIDSEGLNSLIDIFTGLVEGVANYTEALGGSKSILNQFGGIALKVFSKNLSKEISTIALDIKHIGDNADEAKAKTRLFETIFKDANINDKEYQKLMDMVGLAQEYKDVMTQDQQEQLNALILRRNEIANEKDAWEQNVEAAKEYYKTITEESLDIENINIGNKENYIKTLQEQYSAYENKFGQGAINVLKDTNFGTDLNMAEMYMSQAEEALTSGIIKDEKIAEALQKSLDGINGKIQDTSTSFSEEQRQIFIEDFKKAYGDAADHILKESKNVEKVIEQAASGMANAAKNSGEDVEKELADWEFSLKVQSVTKGITDLTSNIMMISSAIDSIGVIPDIWGNTELSTGEKILQTIMAVGNAINGVVQSASAINNIAKIINGVTAAHTVKSGIVIAGEKAEQKAIQETTEEAKNSSEKQQSYETDVQRKIGSTLWELRRKNKKIEKTSEIAKDSAIGFKESEDLVQDELNQTISRLEIKNLKTNPNIKTREDLIKKVGEEGFKNIQNNVRPDANITLLKGLNNLNPNHSYNFANLSQIPSFNNERDRKALLKKGVSEEQIDRAKKAYDSLRAQSTDIILGFQKDFNIKSKKNFEALFTVLDTQTEILEERRYEIKSKNLNKKAPVENIEMPKLKSDLNTDNNINNQSNKKNVFKVISAGITNWKEESESYAIDLEHSPLNEKKQLVPVARNRMLEKAMEGLNKYDSNKEESQDGKQENLIETPVENLKESTVEAAQEIKEEVKDNLQEIVKAENPIEIIKKASMQKLQETSQSILTIGKLLTSIPPQAALVVAGVAALGVAIYAIGKKISDTVNADKIELERLETNLQVATERVVKLTDEFNNLKSSLENFEKLSDSFRELKEGTLEWRQALVDANQEVLKLLDEYPELLKYTTRSEEGKLEISAKGQEYILEKKQSEVENALIEKNRNMLLKTEKEAEILTKSAARSIIPTAVEGNPDSNFYTNIIKAFKDNEEILLEGDNNKIIELLEKKGIDLSQVSKDSLNKIIENIKDNSRNIIDTNLQLGQYTEQIGLYTDEISELIAGTDPVKDPEYTKGVRDYQTKMANDKKEEYKNYYREDLKNNKIDSFGVVDEYMSSLYGEDWTVNKDIKTNAVGSLNPFDLNEDWKKAEIIVKGEDGKETKQTLTQEDMIDYLADIKAKEDIEKNNRSEKAEQDYYKTIKELNKIEDGYGDFLAHLGQGDVTDFYAEEEILKYMNFSLSNMYKRDNNGKFITDGKGNPIFNASNTIWEKDLNIFGLEGDSLYNTLMSSFNNSKTEQAIKNLKRERFEKDTKTVAQQEEINENAFMSYTDQLIANSDALEENDKFAIKAAKSHFDLAEKIEALNVAVTDNEEILQKWKKDEKLSVEEMNVVGEAVTKVKDILGKDISDNFIKDNLNDILKLSTGDISVLDELQKKMNEEYIIKDFDVTKTEELPLLVQALIDDINKMDLGSIKIGTSLDEIGLTGILQELLNSCIITEEQANAILNNIGFEPEITTVQARLKSQAGGGVSATYTDPVTGEQVTIENYQTEKTDGIIEIPVINGTGTEYKGGNSSNFLLDLDLNGNKGKKNKKPKKQESEKDPYQRVNTRLDHINASLEKLEKQKERLLGGDGLKNLINQMNELNQKFDTTTEKLKIANSEKAKMQKEGKNDFGIKFDSDGLIKNYSERYDYYYRQYEKAYKSGNEDRIEKTSEKLAEFVEYIQEYDEHVGSFIPGLIQDLEDIKDKKIETKLEAFNMRVEVTFEFDDARKQWNDFEKEILNDFREDRDFVDLGKFELKRLEQLKEPAAALEDNIKKMLGEYKLSDAGKIMSIFGTEDVNNDVLLLENLKEMQAKGIDVVTEAKEAYKQLKEYWLASYDATEELLNKQIEMMDAAIENYQHNIRLIELTMGEDSYSNIREYQESIAETSKDIYEIKHETFLYWQQELSQLKVGTEEWEAVHEKYMSALQEDQDALESYLESAKELYVTTLNDIFETLRSGFAGGLSTSYIEQEWDLANKYAEKYFDTINRGYESQKIEDEFQDLLDKYQDSATTQSRIKKIMDEQMKILQEQDKLSQYDIDRARLKIQLLEQEIALEEARDNKNKMRLRRDSQGNYSYQYVADEDAVKEAEAARRDKANELYNFDKENLIRATEERDALYTEFQNAMIEANQIEDKQMREATIAMLEERYKPLFDEDKKELEQIIGNIQESAEEAIAITYGEDSAEMTAFKENPLEWILSDTGLGSGMLDFVRNIPFFDEWYEELKKKLQPTTEKFDETMTDGKNAIQEVKDGETQISEQLKTLAEHFEDNADAMKEQTNELEEMTLKAKALNEGFQGLIDRLKLAQDKIEKVYGVNIKEINANDEKIGEQSTTQSNKTITGNNKNNTNNESSLGTASNRAPIIAIYKVKKGDTLSTIGEKYGINWKRIREENGIGKNNLIYPGDKLKIPKYDTGGYTGNWFGDSGQFAMLHKKELVLNKQDTENLLNTVGIVRQLTQNLGGNAFEQLARMAKGQVAFRAADTGVLQQQVSIEANFPNVEHAGEIEEALNNLVNAASQKAGYKDK